MIVCLIAAIVLSVSSSVERIATEGLPISMENPSTIELAAIALGTLALYSLFRRAPRSRSSVANASSRFESSAGSEATGDIAASDEATRGAA